MKSIKYSVKLLSVLALSVACQPAIFSVDPALKLKIITETNILQQHNSSNDSSGFGEGALPVGGSLSGPATYGSFDPSISGAFGAGGILAIGVEESSAGETSPTSTPPESAPSSLYPVIDGNIHLHRLCSDVYTVQVNVAPVITATSLKILIRVAGSIQCENTNTNLIKSMIELGKFDLSQVCSSSFTGQSIEISLLNESNQEIMLKDFSPSTVIYADNNCETGVWSSECGLDGVVQTLSSDPSTYLKCDSKSSPLFVDLRSQANQALGFSLTAPEEGVFFDIQGERSKPLPHTRKKISWFKSNAMAMLVLPNSQGRVNGVNELFGDNTRGPDGKFASDGFAALAKFDNGDRVINQKDSVYKKLSLWLDHDLNGIATPGELLTLSHLGLEAIDLRFDPNFKEIDHYGNEIKFKSVVKFKSGDLRLIYDLWFLTRNSSK